MQNTILYKNTKVAFSSTGKGAVVVLLHGFLENRSMWNQIVPELSKRNRVISIDLLGHGQTACLGYVHTMEEQAAMVYAVLKHLRLRKYVLVGHSMGGYVALAFAKKFTKNVKGVCLLNSTFIADDAERKQLRLRANQMAQTNFKDIVRLSFTNLFSEESRTVFKPELQAALKDALETPLQGYIAAQEGMRLRKDFTSFFAKASFKKVLILGEKDTLIDAEKTKSFAEKHQISLQLLSEGHMSHIENKDDLVVALKRFVAVSVRS